jgi:hypothetical protein
MSHFQINQIKSSNFFQGRQCETSPIWIGGFSPLEPLIPILLYSLQYPLLANYSSVL